MGVRGSDPFGFDNSVFTEMMADLVGGVFSFAKVPVAGDRALLCDVLSDENSIQVVADVPTGCATPVVKVDAGVLAITVERPVPEKTDNFVSTQRHFGRWSAHCKLQDTHDPDSVSAECKDGVLIVTIKRLAKARTKNVDVKTA